MNMDQISIQAKDGAVIRTNAFYPGISPAKGAVIVCHGFGEHSERYGEFAEKLALSGFISIVFDARGHGDLPPQYAKKPKKFYGIIPGYDSFLDDVHDVACWVKQAMPGVPLSLYGHSMGGNIALNYLLKRGEDGFKSAVVESPWIGLYKEVSPFESTLSKVVGAITPNVSIRSNIEPEDITSHKPKAREIEDDPNYHKRISLRMFSGIRDACAYAVKNASRLKLPTFLAVAHNDRIVCNDAIMRFADGCGPNLIMKKYDSYHSIHNDINGAAFYEDLIEFLDA